MVLLVSMEILLPWQQRHVLVTLLFKGIRTPNLLHRSFETTSIHRMTFAMEALLP